MVGRRVGSWILERELGHGGMGAVYEARHVTLKTRAAVKTITRGLDSAAVFRERFHREANLQAQLRHPNVARVIDYVEDQGAWFLVVEFLERGSLADRLARGERVTHEQAVNWIRQALAGLGHAHQHGIVHRDIKPANLLLGAHDEVVVADFGIARAEDAPGLTATGATLGTPHYMSPEQVVTPDRIDGRSDIYSIGIVLYELLAGRKPFDRTSQFEILQAHVSEPPPPLRNIEPSVAPALEAVVMRALGKPPEQRFPDCESMIRAIDAANARGSTAAPPGADMTMHASHLYESARPDTGDQRRQKQNQFRLRMGAGVAAAVFVCSIFAYQLARNDREEEEKHPITETTTTETTTTTDPTTTMTHPPSTETTVTAHRIDEASAIVPPELPNTRTQPQTPALETIASPPAIPPTTLPERPRIAVIGTGDDLLLAGALEQELERRLDAFDVADEHGETAVSDLLEKKGAEVRPPELGAALLQSGFQILVLLRVEEGARRTKTIAGIEGNVKAARMRLNAYLLPANRTIGSGWTQPAEYTELSINVTAKNAFIGPTADLRAAISESWAQLRMSRGAP